MARLMGTKLSERWGVPVVTDNRVGASGAIGSEAVAKSAANGHTLLFTATSHGTVPALRAKLPFDPIKSFEPVALMATSALALVVPPQLGVKNFNEWLALVKAKPGQLNYASPGNGVVQHLAMALLLQETGASMSHVPCPRAVLVPPIKGSLNKPCVQAARPPGLRVSAAPNTRGTRRAPSNPVAPGRCTIEGMRFSAPLLWPLPRLFAPCAMCVPSPLLLLSLLPLLGV